MQYDDGVRAFQMRLPVALLREIGVFRDDVRVRVAQGAEIGPVLVEHHEISITARLEPSDQVLPYQPGPAENNDFTVCHASATAVASRRLYRVAGKT